MSRALGIRYRRELAAAQFASESLGDFGLTNSKPAAGLYQGCPNRVFFLAGRQDALNILHQT
jgi:hypothetical protein